MFKLLKLRNIVKNDIQYSPEPLQVLEAPGLKQDPYVNLLDWSSEDNLAIGLDSGIYCWKQSEDKVVRIRNKSNSEMQVTCLKFNKYGKNSPSLTPF